MSETNKSKEQAIQNGKPETIAVHGGERCAVRENRSINIPIEQTAVYFFKNTRQIHDFYAGKVDGVKYGRYGCPTQHAAEAKIAALESAERSLLFASGMNALTTTILSLVKKGQHLLYIGECYRNTRLFFKEVLPEFGIECTEVPIDNIQNIDLYIKENTVLFFAEIPTNPFLRIIDLRQFAGRLKAKNIVTFIDSTFASPINFLPFFLGADLVMHSATKYLGGHHDLSAGVVSGHSKHLDTIQKARDIFGGIIDPHSSYLLLRGLETLAIRMDVYNRNGLEIARYLESNEGVKKLWYTGLPSHPDYLVGMDFLMGHGGVITFELNADEHQTGMFIDYLKIPYIASSFGGPQSMIEQHALLAYFEHRSEAAKWNINGNLVRYSVGFENTQDVISDLEDGLNYLNQLINGK